MLRDSPFSLIDPEMDVIDFLLTDISAIFFFFSFVFFFCIKKSFKLDYYYNNNYRIC